MTAFNIVTTGTVSIEIFSPGFQGFVAADVSEAVGETTGNIGSCATTIITFTGSPVLIEAFDVVSSTVTCTPVSGVAEFPIASLSSLILIALLLPAIFLMGTKFRATARSPTI